MKSAEMFRFQRKLASVILTIASLLIMPVVSLAQGPPPCVDGDPFNPCPLDTWVIVAAFFAVTFAVIHLHRKQKALLQLTKIIN